MFQNQQINQSSIFFRKQKNKLKMEELSWLDTEIIPKCGDFSFIKHKFMRISLTFDYNVFRYNAFAPAISLLSLSAIIVCPNQ